MQQKIIQPLQGFLKLTPEFQKNIDSKDWQKINSLKDENCTASKQQPCLLFVVKCSILVLK
jgi:hypothetical protein